MLFGWYDTWSRCFVQGCFTYDLAVQIVGTLGALGIALLVYWRTQEDQDSAAKTQRATEQARFDSQTAQLQQQIEHNLAEAERQSRRWLSEQRTHAMERELAQANQHISASSVIRMDLQKLFAKNQASSQTHNNLTPSDTFVLDTMTGAYSLLPGEGSVQTIRAAHEMAILMATGDPPSPKSRDLFGSLLDNAILTLESLEKALAESADMLNMGLREEAGLRVDIIAEVDEFERAVNAHKEAPEE